MNANFLGNMRVLFGRAMPCRTSLPQGGGGWVGSVSREGAKRRLPMWKNGRQGTAARGRGRVSRQLITEYRSELDRIHAASGSKRESVVREAFKDLLKRWGKSRDLIFLAEHEYLTPQGDRRYIDGALVHSIRVPFGYWEAKDTNDDLDEEILKKIAKGYPRDNIIYEDTATAVLIQNKREIARARMDDADTLFHLLESFFSYERPEIADFRKAVRQFASDLPAVLERLREIIAERRAASRDFARAELRFLDHAREAINPAVIEEDVQEMLIQHILTESIFAKVFNNPDFHRKNNVAHALYELEEKLLSYPEKQKLLTGLRPYYAGIESTAALIESHSETQQFLKGLYENFYKVYNPLAADRLGVVYTPGEVVRFMVRSADWLCHKHFGKGLDDRGVEILDPATGTGTFIVELLEHLRGNREKLAYKYKEELHANEVAILPYYVANLNIEATYQAITGQFAEFPGLVFVDTLDNVDALGIYSGHQHDLLGAIADENVERIKRQNRRKISVIIGNPPYNANQQSENQNNKNRVYQRVDERIKQTYIKASTAQKTKLYDMYVRFLRWASDRLNEDGILAFVSNSSFLHKNSFDGVRATLEREFNELWVLDLKGDARTSGEARRRQGGNVFGDQIKVGVAVYLLVKRKGAAGFQIHYDAISDYATADDKLAFLDRPVSEREMTIIKPDDQHSWVDQATEDASELLPLASKKTKAAATKGQERAVFKLYSLGISTNRDDWLYDRSKSSLSQKVKALIAGYEQTSAKGPFEANIKWSRNLKRRLSQRRRERFSNRNIVNASYRPFNRRCLYQSELFIDEAGAVRSIFPPNARNTAICFSDVGARTNYCVMAINGIADLHFGAAVDAYQQVPCYRYTKSGDRLDNVTDWAVKQFEAQYGKKAGVTKHAIFAYCYAVLHDPIYREKYTLNLKREFPRIPFYDDFAKWSGWGQQLLDLHIGYEKEKLFKFTRMDTPNPKRAKGSHPKAKLKSGPDEGLVIVDEDTQLTGIPREAWDYRLGNRSAIDWVLDQHKEKTPRDPTIRAKFNTYRFADHKEEMIKLLARVITVSLETVKITEAMRALERKADS
jgi:predicted helicase